MTKLWKLALLTAVLISCSLAGHALPATYHIFVDTSSLSGTNGSLDFNFNGGPLSFQSASVSVVNLTTDGTPGASTSTIGDASGSLAGGVNLDNGMSFNDFFSGFTYGSSLGFDVSLFGPALSTPDGTSTSGSTFAFSLFSDPAGTIPTFTTDTVNGYGYTVNVNLDGTTTATSYLTSTTPVTPGPVPEPSSLVLLATATLLGAKSIRQRYLQSFSR